MPEFVFLLAILLARVDPDCLHVVEQYQMHDFVFDVGESLDNDQLRGQWFPCAPCQNQSAEIVCAVGCNLCLTATPMLVASG